MSQTVQNIQSNAIRGSYKDQIMDKVFNEIHDDMCTIFGPYAIDAFITKNQQPYYTRDGLEVLRTLQFDNELAMYILEILYQAVHRQGKVVGDGTTTLAVFYTNLYKALCEELEVTRADDTTYRKTIHRDTWNRAVAHVNDLIKKNAVQMTKEDLKNVIYTCCQDVDLTRKIYLNLGDAIMDHSYIIISKSNIDTDFSMTVHQEPLFQASKAFSIRPVNASEEHCTVLHCNGMLDIANKEVLVSLMSCITQDPRTGQGQPKTIILLCNGMTDVTRRTLKSMVLALNELIKVKNLNLEEYNNIAIYTLDHYREYTQEHIEDISTIITDENGIGGLVNPLIFESMLYQAIADPNVNIETLNTFDCDPRLVDKMRMMIASSYPIDFDESEGFRIKAKLGPVAEARYQALKEEIKTEKSEVRKIALNRRLRTSFGNFIEVEVGSKLIKDSQRKYELILDAILSASDGIEKGILKSNSILAAMYYIAQDQLAWLNQEEEHNKPDAEVFLFREYIRYILIALIDTMEDLLGDGHSLDEVMQLKDSTDTVDNIVKGLSDKDLSTFYCDPMGKRSILWTKEAAETAIKPVVRSSDPEADPNFTVTEELMEPVGIITSILENSSVVIDLFNSKTIHLEHMINNYI